MTWHVTGVKTQDQPLARRACQLLGSESGLARNLSGTSLDTDDMKSQARVASSQPGRERLTSVGHSGLTVIGHSGSIESGSGPLPHPQKEKV